jgi:LysR family transcriptional regulator (chromosome initiation inhibitor)
VGWSLNPEPLVASHVARRRLVDLTPERSLDVELQWQYWAIASRTMEALEEALREEAARALAPV